MGKTARSSLYNTDTCIHNFRHVSGVSEPLFATALPTHIYICFISFYRVILLLFLLQVSLKNRHPLPYIESPFPMWSSTPSRETGPIPIRLLPSLSLYHSSVALLNQHVLTVSFVFLSYSSSTSICPFHSLLVSLFSLSVIP